jgi:hypothetical protein
MRRMADSFQFCSSAKLVELTGRRARTVPELAEGIRALDDAVLFHHTHHYVFPTDHRATTLAEFADHLERVSLQSIYHHVFEARLRLPRATNDFAWWFRDSLGEKELAESVEHLDPYVFTLEDLRARILQLVKRRL